MSELEPLTDEQYDNWRRVLLGTLGPYAMVMPRSQIDKMREMMQEDADKLGEELDK
jgi:hypothetical protein